MKDLSTKTKLSASSIGYFNLARGIGLLLVVFFHTAPMSISSDDPVFNHQLFVGPISLLGAGIMMAFFYISGYSFFPMKPKQCIKLQTKLLLRPYYIIAVLAIASKLLLALVERRPFMEHGGELLLTYLLAINYGGGGTIWGLPVDTISIFWFIWALFGGWVLYNFIARLKNEKLRIALSAACPVLGYALTLISKVWAFCIPMMLLAVGGLAFGSYIRKRNLLEKKLPLWVYPAAIVPMAISCVFGRIDIAYCIWNGGLIDVISAFCAGFFILRLYTRLKRTEKSGKITGAIELVGAKSIVFFAIHAYEKVIFPWYRIFNILSEHPLLATALCFILRCAVIYGIYLLTELINGKIRKTKRKKVILES